MQELANKQVMVHPLLTNDPARMQGQVGFISHIDVANDEVHVQFPYSQSAIYSTNALLSLQPKELILAIIREKLIEFDPKDVRILLDIYKLQTNGKPAAIEEALRWAIAFEVVGGNSLVTLQDFIDRGMSDTVEIQQSRSR